MKSMQDENEIFAPGRDDIGADYETGPHALPEQSSSSFVDGVNIEEDDHSPQADHVQSDGKAQSDSPDSLAGIVDSIKGFQEELARNRKEIESQRALLELLGADTWSKRLAADEQAFLDNVRETFARDPAEATSILIAKAQEKLWQAFEKRLNEETRQKTELERFMGQIVSNPDKAPMNDFRDEIEFLVRERGMAPEESVGLIEKISAKLNRNNDRKKAAIRKMRSESQFESAGHASNAADPDREFTRLMSQAKSLDEMFANLGKINS